MLKKKRWIGLCLISLFCATGCQTMNNTQAVYFEDRDMDFETFHEQLLEENMYTYREAAAGGTKGKTGGGCGCN